MITYTSYSFNMRMMGMLSFAPSRILATKTGKTLKCGKRRLSEKKERIIETSCSVNFQVSKCSLKSTQSIN